MFPSIKRLAINSPGNGYMFQSSVERSSIAKSSSLSWWEIAEFLKQNSIKSTELGKNFFVLKKQIYAYKKLRDRRVANLIVPRGSVIYHNPHGENLGGFSLKLRTNLAVVHSIWDAKDKRFVTEGTSYHDNSFVYEIKKVVSVRDFSFENRTCGAGIHFFLNLDEALNY